MAWSKTALREPAYHLERANHWHKMLVALAAPVNQANYQTLVYVHCGMAIDALPPDDVSEALHAIRDEIWERQQCETHLPELLKKITTAVRRAEQEARPIGPSAHRPIGPSAHRNA
jgi:hypothetical protein